MPLRRCCCGHPLPRSSTLTPAGLPTINSSGDFQPPVFKAPAKQPSSQTRVVSPPHFILTGPGRLISGQKLPIDVSPTSVLMLVRQSRTKHAAI